MVNSFGLASGGFEGGGNRVMILKDQTVQTATPTTPIRIISANQLSNGQQPQIVQLIAQHVNPVNQNLLTIIPANQVSSSRLIQSPNIKVKTPRKFVLASSSAQIQSPVSTPKRRQITTRFSPQQPIRSVHREILPKPLVQTSTIQGTSGTFGRMVALERHQPVQYIIQSGAGRHEPVVNHSSQASFGYCHSGQAQLIYTTDLN